MVRPIPDLRRKFRLLIDHGRYSGWKELAAALGKSRKTPQWWADGSDVRKPGTVPPESLLDVIDLFARALPAARGEQAVRALLYGPAADLEQELIGSPETTMMQLIADEADTLSGTLIITDKVQSDLVESRKARSTASNAPRVRLGEWFRLEFQTAFDGAHLFAVQNVQKLWGPLDATLSGRAIFLPEFDDDGEPDFICEERDTGTHRFVVMQTAAPVPPEIRISIEEQTTLDMRLLNRLADFYVAQDKGRRKLFAMDIRIDANK